MEAIVKEYLKRVLEIYKNTTAKEWAGKCVKSLISLVPGGFIFNEALSPAYEAAKTRDGAAKTERDYSIILAAGTFALGGSVVVGKGISNITSITDHGVGDYTITLAQTYADPDYFVLAQAEGATVDVIGQTAGSFRISIKDRAGEPSPIDVPVKVLVLRSSAKAALEAA